MIKKITRPKEGNLEVLLDKRDRREVYRKLHEEVVEKALPELEQLAIWRAKSAGANMLFF